MADEDNVLYLATRGHMDHVERWIRSMRSLWLPFKSRKRLKDENGRDYDIDAVTDLDVQLRPIQLWEVVLPDAKFMAPMCNSLGLPNTTTFFDSTYKMEDGTEHSNNEFISGKGIKLGQEALRIALGANKIPPMDPTKGQLLQPIYRQHVNVIGIGTRSDKMIKTVEGEHKAV